MFWFQEKCSGLCYPTSSKHWIRLNFQQHSHGGREGYAFIAHQCQDLATFLTSLELFSFAMSIHEENSCLPCASLVPQSQRLVVIHNSIHGFYPGSINVPVENDPLVQMSALVSIDFLDSAEQRENAPC